jgi:penicillin-binding protein 1A
MVDAFLVAEDDSFFEHQGVDIKALARALKELVSAGDIKTGGSTITMQVARNFFLNRAQTLDRKYQEILLALKIEQHFSKEEILELYLNKIFLGYRAYGVNAAAEVYYGKTLDELNLAEIAMIAGLPKAPSSYNPIANPARALERRNWILGRLYRLGKIDATAYQTALDTPVTASYHGKRTAFEADYAVDWAIKAALETPEVADWLAQHNTRLFDSGLRIETTIEPEWQLASNRAVHEGLTAYDKRHGWRGVSTHFTGNLLSLNEVREFLGNKPETRWIKPAIVSQTSGDHAIAILGNGEQVRIDADSMTWAGRYLNENSRGRPPSGPAELMGVGDMIYVEQSGQGWALSQIPAAQAALISIDPGSGAIKAMTGGLDHDVGQGKFNRATQAKRQPGSTFKPFLYAAALNEGYTAASTINDAPIVVEGAGDAGDSWRPDNSSGNFYGPTRLREGLYRSRNLISIRLLDQMGIQTARNYLKRLGFPANRMPSSLSLALGTGEMSPLEIAQGYAIIANGGYFVIPHVIQRVTDSKGQIVFEQPTLTPCDRPELRIQHDTGNCQPRVMEARINYIINSILRDVIQKGTGTAAKALNRDDIAGKTGTTNNQRDAWFAGFNPTFVAISWMGFDDYSPLGKKEYGARAALPAWMSFVSQLEHQIPAVTLEQPEGMISRNIDPNSGLAVAFGQPGIREIFRTEFVPAFSNESFSPIFSGMDNTGYAEPDSGSIPLHQPLPSGPIPMPVQSQSTIEDSMEDRVAPEAASLPTIEESEQAFEEVF